MSPNIDIDTHIEAIIASPWTIPIVVALGTFLLTFFWAAWIRKRRVHAAYEAGLVSDAEARRAERERLQATIDEHVHALTRTETRLESNGEQLADMRRENGDLRSELEIARNSVSDVRARLEENRKAFAEKEVLFKDSSDALKKEFEALANRIFQTQGESFARSHEKQLTDVLTPFKEQMADFKKKVEEVYHTDARDRASLLTEVKSLQRSSERINAEAENLARALKGDKKLQGNWGEMVLERVLEESGLRSGYEYLVQESRRSKDGDLKRPDVLIRLPDNKDVVIDAKVSLNAYEEALATEDEVVRERAMRQHVMNLRNHVRRLSEQDYDQLDGVRSLDFVLMFVPIESAFTMAMEAEQKLFNEAFHKRIVIVSPTTLMMALRIINNVWRYEKQNRNAQVIAERAGALYDKLRSIIEDVVILGQRLKTVEKSYDAVYGKLATGKGNLVRQVEQFRELGAVVKKPMPTAVLEQSQTDDEGPQPPKIG